MQLCFFRARQNFYLDSTETVQDDSSGGPRSGIFSNALDCKLSEFGRTARARKLAHFISVDGKRRRGAGKMMIIREAARSNFREYNAERENVGRKVKLVAQKDFGGHVCVCAAKGETTGLFLVAGCDAGKSKIGDLETTVCSDEQVLALQVTVDAFTSMEVGEGTCDISCKGKSETPGQRLRFVMDILAEVTCA
jgi:hypothetical protein